MKNQITDNEDSEVNLSKKLEVDKVRNLMIFTIICTGITIFWLYTIKSSILNRIQVLL